MARSMDEPCPYDQASVPQEMRGAHDIVSTIDVRNPTMPGDRVRWLYCRRCGATKHLAPPGYVSMGAVASWLRDVRGQADENAFMAWVSEQMR